MKRLYDFLSYHNAVPAALGIVFLGAGGVFATTNPDTILSTQEEVLTIDNTYIANKNLDSFTPAVEIREVTEDETHYYVRYDFRTIDIVDHVWQDVAREEQMKVSKKQLGQHRDLGLYAMEQLQQKIDREIAYLKEVQQIERRQISNKQVATAYGGLVGAFLDDKTETVPGYTPVVTPPPEPEPRKRASNDTQQGSQNTTRQAQNSSGSPANTAEAPKIQILGNNPARVELRAQYSDLGAIVSDDKDSNLGLNVLFNGEEVSSVSLDTSTTATHRITYRATDTDGNVGEATREVIVYDPAVTSPSSSGQETVDEQPQGESQDSQTQESDAPEDEQSTQNATSTDEADETQQPDAPEDEDTSQDNATSTPSTEEQGGAQGNTQEDGSTTNTDTATSTTDTNTDEGNGEGNTEEPDEESGSDEGGGVDTQNSADTSENEGGESGSAATSTQETSQENGGDDSTADTATSTDENAQ